MTYLFLGLSRGQVKKVKGSMTKIGTSNYTQCEEMYFNHLDRLRGVLLRRIEGESSYHNGVTQCTGQVMLHVTCRRNPWSLWLKMTLKMYFKIVGYLSINKDRSQKSNKSDFVQVRSAPICISYLVTCHMDIISVCIKS